MVSSSASDDGVQKFPTCNPSRYRSICTEWLVTCTEWGGTSGCEGERVGVDGASASGWVVGAESASASGRGQCEREGAYEREDLDTAAEVFAKDGAIIIAEVIQTTKTMAVFQMECQLSQHPS